MVLSIFRPRLPFLLVVALLSAVASAQSNLTPVSGRNDCGAGCDGFLLPGQLVPSPRTAWRIDSDLPEIFRGSGVLYTTAPVLPPFNTAKNGALDEAMRTQRNLGFEAIDGSFEVFLYHLLEGISGGETCRIVVYAQNTGTEDVTISPRQAIFHGPNAARVGSVESKLGEAVLAERWEHPILSNTIPPGFGAVVGYTKRLGARRETDDETPARFVTGILRAEVQSSGDAKPSLVVSVVAIPGSDDITGLSGAVAPHLEHGAESRESMDLSIVPPQCHVRRVVGVARNVMWETKELEVDLATLPGQKVGFPMAMMAVQSVGGCESTRQTADLALHPPYVHPESIGNYMMEYHVTFKLTNSSKVRRVADLLIGKKDQKIGIACQIASGAEALDLAALVQQPVQSIWAGKGSEGAAEPDFTRTLLPSGPLAVKPGETIYLNARLMVLGTSSLPYQLYLTSQERAR